MPTYTVDHQSLHSPCWCGESSFKNFPLGKFKSCRVIRCVSCGMLRTFPEPSPDSLRIKYSSVTEKYSPQADQSSTRDLFEGFGDGIVRSIEEFCPSRGKLLDVGCNLGYTMAAAQRRGWHVEGLEINPDVHATLQAKGYKVHKRPLEDRDLAESSYDALVAEQVLEHVPRPIHFLEAARRVVRPNGVISLGMPCFLGPIPLMLKRDEWYALLPDEHIWQFSEGSLKRLARSMGFKVLKYRRGCSDFAGRPSVRPKAAARFLLYKAISAFGLGDFNSILLRNIKSA